MLLAGEGLKTERWLRNRFTAWRRQLQEGGLEERPGRTVAQLRENLAKAQELRLKKERKDRERIEAQRRKERELYLTVLAKDFSKVWDRARANVLKGIASSYDTACQTLVDLSDAYTLHSTPEAFTKELGRFMADYLKRKSFIERLVKAGIWKG
jgi:hypothetical protein